MSCSGKKQDMHSRLQYLDTEACRWKSRVHPKAPAPMEAGTQLYVTAGSNSRKQRAKELLCLVNQHKRLCTGYLRQFSSSLLSGQSSSPSHLHTIGTHAPLLHWNCPVSHSDCVWVPVFWGKYFLKKERKKDKLSVTFISHLEITLWISQEWIRETKMQQITNKFGRLTDKLSFVTNESGKLVKLPQLIMLLL